MLALGPTGGIHAVANNHSEGTDRQMLLAVEDENRWAVGAITSNGEGDNRHRVTLTQSLGTSGASDRQSRQSPRDRETTNSA